VSAGRVQPSPFAGVNSPVRNVESPYSSSSSPVVSSWRTVKGLVLGTGDVARSVLDLCWGLESCVFLRRVPLNVDAGDTGVMTRLLDMLKYARASLDSPGGNGREMSFSWSLDRFCCLPVTPALLLGSCVAGAISNAMVFIVR